MFALPVLKGAMTWPFRKDSFTVHFTQADKTKAVTGLATGLALLALTSCGGQHPKAEIVAPPQPVGHVYPTEVAVPPPVSPRIHFTASQEEQAQQAFNVISLKSALMVAALSCGDQSQYDAFVTKYQPHILAEQHVIDGYFYKASGPYSGQKMEDNFITLLANNQSVSGISQGRTYCLNSQAEYNAVGALKTQQQLDSFATDEPPGALPSTAPTVTVASATVPAHDKREARHTETRRERHEHEARVAAKHTKTETKTDTKKVAASPS
jgi:hypothetical protein